MPSRGGVSEYITVMWGSLLNVSVNIALMSVRFATLCELLVPLDDGEQLTKEKMVNTAIRAVMSFFIFYLLVCDFQISYSHHPDNANIHRWHYSQIV